MINQRRDHFKSIFKTLRKAHIKRKDLYLAWDFTVSSDKNIAARMLHIRDDAFAQLGDTNLADLAVAGAAPQFSVSSVRNFTAAREPQPRPRRAGNVHRALLPAPRLRPRGHLPARFQRAADPQRQLDRQLHLHHPPRRDRSRCRPSRPSLYGHGLLGTAVEVVFHQPSRHWRSWPTSPSAPPIRSASHPPCLRPAEPLQLPETGGPGSAGIARRALPGAVDDPPQWLPEQRGLPRRRDHRLAGGNRSRPPLLPRQQPGRHPRRSADRGGPRLHPRFARGAGDELLGVAQPPVHRQGPLPAGPRSCLPRQADPTTRRCR